MRRGLAVFRLPVVVILALAAFIWPLGARADEIDMAKFEAWRKGFRGKALEAGISEAVFARALGRVEPNAAVKAANERQPEHARAVWDYIEGATRPARVEEGRARLEANAALFKTVSETYGVRAETLAAIWGLESDFGKNVGSYNLFEALATLAFDGRRQTYGEAQLIAALKIVERGDKPIEKMVGSWAGAMGQTQFIPTTYLQYAIDGDGDGRRDLFDSLSDVMSSTANYLAASGWQRGAPWGREVTLPQGFEFAAADPSVRLPMKQWRAMGVKELSGELVPETDELLTLLVPAGHRGPAFFVTDNFRAVLKYNNSTAYALAINHLADRFAGGDPFKGAWPRDERPLTLTERMEMQSLLKTLGYEIGEVDGVVGAQTRAGLKQYQRAKGKPADGFATVALLEAMRKDAGFAPPASGPQDTGASAEAAPPQPTERPEGGMAPVRSPGDPDDEDDVR